MRNHFNLRKGIHIITDFNADGFTNMLHIIKTSNIPIIANAKEKRTAQAICKSAYTLQPTFRLILFKQ